MQSSASHSLCSKKGKSAFGYTVEGIHYPTLSALAAAYHIKITTLSRRLHSPYWSIEQACELSPAPDRMLVCNLRPLSVQGKEYRSRTAACAAYGVKTNVFYARRRSGWSVEEALGIVVRKKYSKAKSEPWTIAGKEYASFQEACEALSLIPSCVRSRLAGGWSFDEAFGLVPRTPPRGPTKEERSGKNGVIVISGKRFSWKHSSPQV